MFYLFEVWLIYFVVHQAALARVEYLEFLYGNNALSTELQLHRGICTFA